MMSGAAIAKGGAAKGVEGLCGGDPVVSAGGETQRRAAEAFRRAGERGHRGARPSRLVRRAVLYPNPVGADFDRKRPSERDSVELAERPPAQQQLQAQQQLDLIPDSELDYQDSLIAEREAEIREIETGIHELNEIFRDLGTIVQEQGGLIGAPPIPVRVKRLARLTVCLDGQTTSRATSTRSATTREAPSRSSPRPTSTSVGRARGCSASCSSSSSSSPSSC